jgi:zinc protease
MKIVGGSACRALRAATLVAMGGPAMLAADAAAELRDLGGGAFADRIDGGPRLLLVPQRSVPMFSCTVLVPAGSALETTSTNGAAHYLEHLLFNGTTTRTREEIYALGDRLGAYNNASTQRERTVFQLLLPSERWREGLELQADMLLHSTLPPEMFEKEKGIILEELAKDRSDPSYEAERFAQRAVWGDSPWSLPVLGTEESITAMDPAVVAAFYREHYRPAGFTMIVMGDFDLEEARGEIARLYGGNAGGEPAPLPASLRFPADPMIRFLELADLGRLEVRVTLPLGTGSPQFVAAHGLLLADVLESGERSAVSGALARAGFTVLSSSVAFDLGGPWFACTIGADLPVGADGAAAVQAILAYLADVTTGERIAADLETARLQRVVEEISLREQMHYYGLMRADLLDGDPAAGFSVLEELERVPAARLSSLLRNALDQRNAQATVVGQGASGSSSALRVPVPAGAPPEPDSGGKRVGLPAAAVAKTSEIRVRELPGGLRLIVESAPGARTFAVHVLFRDRAAVEIASGVPHGTSDVVHRVMQLGTESLGEDELRGRLGALGAKLKVTDADGIPYDDYYFSPEFSYVRLETIDAFAIPAIALLGQIIRRPRLDAGALATAVEAAAVRAERDETQPEARASQAFHAALGENHPLAHGVYGPAAALRSLSLDDVRRHHAAMIDASRVIIAVSGSVPADDVETAVTRAFGDLPAGAPAAAPAFAASDAGAHRVEIETGREQSSIVLGSPLALDAGDEAALRVAVAVLSDRLAERLREREGLAYSIGASVRLDAPGPNVRMTAGTRPENLPRMEAGMREVVATLASDPPSPEEIEGARNRGEGRSRMRRLTRIGQAYALATAELRGRDAKNLDADRPALAAVAPEDVARVARRYLEFEDSICAIAR